MMVSSLIFFRNDIVLQMTCTPAQNVNTSNRSSIHQQKKDYISLFTDINNINYIVSKNVELYFAFSAIFNTFTVRYVEKVHSQKNELR